eukprot:12886708-Prorocentrum_lima.AAC.1
MQWQNQKRSSWRVHELWPRATRQCYQNQTRALRGRKMHPQKRAASSSELAGQDHSQWTAAMTR